MPIDPLSPFVTNLDRPVFALRGLPEEVVAVLFAYYSRSPHSLRDNLRRLLAEGDLAVAPAADSADDEDTLAAARAQARRFHEKWVVGYGHSSVAEHAVVHLAIEDVSIVATKAIEDCRLASYTEKSTRYVPFDSETFVREPAIAAGPLAGLYEDTCRHLLATYGALLPTIEQQVTERFPRPADWADARYRSVCRSRACDVARYLLPAATRTNLGLTINGRALEHLLSKLYSSPLGELRALAQALRGEAEAVVPTLIKYAGESAYLSEMPRVVAELAEQMLVPSEQTLESNGARLVCGPEDPLTDLTAAILYEATHQRITAVRAQVEPWPDDRKLAVIRAYLAGRGRFDQPGRALEHLTYSFEMMLDYGAFRDIQRHRMCTQTGQTLTCEHGYETPDEIDDLGHAEVYHEAMARAAAAHAQLAEAHGEEAAQYVLPLAQRKRVLFTWNLREMHHFIGLRSSRQGHVSYRRIAQACWRELNRIHPELAADLRVDLADYDLARG